MANGVYGLGVDIGDATAVAAITRTGEAGTSPRVLHLGGATPAMPATVRLDGEGRVLPFADPEGGSAQGTVVAAHALSRCGGPSPYSAGSAAVPATEVLTALVQWICARATEQEGDRPASVVLVVPPSWAEHRRALLAEALACGVDLPCAVVSGAEAVVRAHAESGRLSGGSVVAVYDLGASTLDTAVVDIDGCGTADHRAAPRPPLHWGARDIDDALFEHVLGNLPPVRHGRRPDIPAHVGRALRARCVDAKESLSTETVVRLPIDLPGSPLSFLRLTRSELEELVAEPLADSVEALRVAARDAGVDVADLDAVVLAGGGTRLPLVTETLSAALGRPIVVDDEPEFTGARGAALLARALLEERDAETPGEEGVPESEAADSVPRAAGGSRTRVRSPGRTPAGVRRPPSSQHSAAAAARRRRARQGVLVLGAVGTLLILPTSQLGTAGDDSSALATDQRAQAAEELPAAASPAAPSEAAATDVPADQSVEISVRGAEQPTRPARSSGPARSAGASSATVTPGRTPTPTPTAADFAGATAVGTADRTAADPTGLTTGAPATSGTPQSTGTDGSVTPSTAVPSTSPADSTPQADTAPDATPDATPQADTAPDATPDATPQADTAPDATPDATSPADTTGETVSEPDPAAPPQGPGPTETA